jgi:hypothetical protein
MNKLIRGAATVVASLSLAGGFAGIAGATSSGSISTTGPGSRNNVTSEYKVKTTVKNTNQLGVTNANEQGANSGSVGVYRNTTGGDAGSGDVATTNATSVSATVTNASMGVSDPSLGSGGSGSIDTTGPDSQNTVSSKTDVTTNLTNDNYLTVTNTSSQEASSGSAKVAGNTSGGSATSGSVTESNMTTVSLDVNN